MSESRSKELKRHGKKGANRGETEDGPSNFPLASTPGDDFHDEGVDTGGRVRKRKNIGEEMELQDPFVAFGSEIMVMILKQLDARSVARSRLISRGWHSIASSDEIWSRKMSASIPKQVLKKKEENRVHYPAIPSIQLDSWM
ncbi:uncharacterized protein LOC111371589 isoform X2 [Olea europaea var. sylvestris]|uniref:uncharacterized protein LOC111371589 isoform X2 n=1 Tax=Olea europaea var. sylvestris TaxID=158386 RepID=UPI000C1D3CD1|nr:uncharacterized protein LOC111371589 isoform X2 [Olea europaea var. sylvestris]